MRVVAFLRRRVTRIVRCSLYIVDSFSNQFEAVRNIATASLWVLRHLAAVVLVTSTSLADEKLATPILNAMRLELFRNFEALSREPEPPYFISYEVTDLSTHSYLATMGEYRDSKVLKNSNLDIDLRVGSPVLDNSHYLSNSWQFTNPDRSNFPFDSLDGLRTTLWFDTNNAYMRALERFAVVKGQVSRIVKEEDQSGDFSSAPAEYHIEEVRSLAIDGESWIERLEDYSSVFAPHDFLLSGNAQIYARRQTRRYVNTEGTVLRLFSKEYHLILKAHAKANDGDEFSRFEAFRVFDEHSLPSAEVIKAAALRIVEDLKALREAPLMEPYSGPAMLSSTASAVFFHEILGHHIEGHRQKQIDQGQTFKSKVGEQILPDTFSIFFDPTQKQYAATDLIGYYLFDNEGIKARRVAVVENGIFKRFLMSRSPIVGHPESNGHGRKEIGAKVVARQSNLIVEVMNPQTEQKLLNRLLEIAQQEGRDYALYFDLVAGGFTTTKRHNPTTFNVLPVMVYKVYLDGTKELVRGVQLIGTPLTTLNEVVAGGGTVSIFNGFCGAESGNIPISAVSPMILISRIEVQRKDQSTERPPILSPPAYREKNKSI